jgi:hypothetical protein
VDPVFHHIDIMLSCLGLMKERLKKNICDLSDYVILSKVKGLPARKEAYIGGALEYACRFWTKHLAKIPSDGSHLNRVQEAIEDFFTKRLLFWIEVLSIGGHLEAGISAISDIRQWYHSVSDD